MKISKIFEGTDYKLVGEDVEVSGLCQSSKSVAIGMLYFAIRGKSVDGADYIAEAIERGAVAIVVDEEYYSEHLAEIELFSNVSYVVTQNVRDIVGYACYNYNIAKEFKFKMVGITGTNGKTTISFMISHCLINAGYSVGVIGTSGIFVNGDNIRGEGLTTPDPIDLYDILNFFNMIGVDYVVMEVSAHALDLNKLNGLVFDVGIFTNLTEDHLDYFKTMEEYGKAKSKLFDICKFSIINTDDNFGKDLYKCCKTEKRSVGKSNADYQILKSKINETKLKGLLGKICLKSYLIGDYNKYNTAEAYVALCSLGMPEKIIRKSFKSLPKISGRMNIYESKYRGKFILDFAHTPDGLEKMLTTAKSMAGKHKLISVFGCGGNRDKAKRGMMGEVAGKIADYTYISIDNPRFEEPMSVMKDIECGIKNVSDNYCIVMPRIEAIKKAFLMSQKGDIIVVSGKGTEPYYDDHGQKHIYREDIVIKSVTKNFDK